MIVIINGPCGIGKTSVAWELLSRFERAVMLDGDYLGAVHPFAIDDDARVEYLYRTLCHLIEFHREQGDYRNFVINYVFEDTASLASLRQRLCQLDPRVYAFRLLAEPAAIEARIMARERNPEERAWYLQRYKELVAIQDRAARHGDIGFPIDTSARDVAQVADLIYRMTHDEIKLALYDEAWPVAFESERQRVVAALGELALAVHHIGSTAVPGLSAKPIVDLMVEVRQLDHAQACIAPLAGLGYAFVDHPENTDRRFFRRGMPRTQHLHIVETGSACFEDLLDFRDALRTDSALREDYQRLKTDLSQRYRCDRAAYTINKSAFVVATLSTWRASRCAS